MHFPDRLEIPEDVLEIAETLHGAGYEAWCVGGAIRDTLLGEANTDYDVATSATPEVVKKLFEHTVPVGERFGTVAVRTRRRHHEVTTFRKDVSTDGRHAVVEYGASLDEDLARRDFTVNAIAYEPLRHEWRDLFDGLADLEAGVIRAVGVPLERFREDYLRILRAIRFAARFGFTIDPGTWEAAREATPGLAQLSAERVREEWYKGLRGSRSIKRLVELWWDSGAAAILLPELLKEGPEPSGPLDTTPENPLLRRHELVGRMGQQAASLANRAEDRGTMVRRDPVLLTTLLCLDPVGVLVRLKASGSDIARAAAVLSGPSEPPSLSVMAVRRWMAAVGDAADDLTAIWHMRNGVEPLWEPVMRGIRERGEPLTRRMLAVTGGDLQAVGIAPGPGMGHVLDRLLALVVDDPSQNTRETLLAHARKLA
ncbi:MAG TPA: CCA tRNA nucleotidyltransferase [Gemmatimonadales bacterium]|jgi:tRNA nucleotidyltransferase (CCA-adding enzyme)